MAGQGQPRPLLAEAAGWGPPSAKPRSLPRPLAGAAAGQGQLPSRLFRAGVAAGLGQPPSRLFQVEVAEQLRPLHFPPLRRHPRSCQVGAEARRVGVAVPHPEAAGASEPHLEVAAGPRPGVGAAWAPPLPEPLPVVAEPRPVVAGGPPLEAAVAWARPHLEVAAVHQAAEAVSAPQEEAAVSHPAEAAAWRQAVPEAPRAVPEAPQVVSAAQVVSVAHQRQEASGVHQVRAASAGRPPRQVSAGRRQAGRAVPASPSPPVGHDHPRPCTAPTAAGRTSRASAVPLPPRVRRPGPARGPPSPPSIPGTPRTNRRTCQLPCCGSRRSCTRSRPVHLHSVHDVCRLGGRHRRVDQVHWHARRVVHPDPHGQPR
jgi:hypothetical protein